MSTYSKIFIAIIAITLGCHQLSYAVLEPVDQDWINDRLADGDHSFTFEADQEGQYEGYNITEDISIPQGENCAGDFTYTIEFEPGADIYFDSGTSLTITTNGDGVGRIVAEGEDEDMVTFTSSEGFPVAGDWGGIIIETDPGEESPNIIDYCEISYAGMDVNANRHAIYINDACVEVKNSIICHNGFPTGGGRTAGTGILIEGGDCDFTIEDNEIYHSSTPIWILGGETIEINEDYSITRNRMYSNTHHGIYIEAPFTGDITNNLVYDTGLDEWDSVLLNLDFRNTGLIANNVLDGTSPDSDFEGAVFGDMEEGEWSPNFINNIIVNCETAVVGVGDEESVVNYNFIDNCAAAFEQCEEGIGCLVNEDDPEFVDDDNGDYHLDWNSSAIDIGRNWLNVSGDDLLTDLNFTYNDMGAYGGPTADPEMAGIFFGEVVDGTHHVETDGTVWYNYTLTVDDGITLEFDDDTGLQIFGDLIVTGDFGGSGVVFKKYVEAEDWDGLNFYGGGHNSSIEYAEIKDAYWDGITISATYVPLISNCLIHDNGRRGIFIWWADDGTTTISDCVIYQNNEYGIYIGVDGGPAAMVIIEDCEIYENDYGLFIVDTPFISTDNLFTENELYGVFVCSWTTATMYGDIIEWNSTGETDDAGIGFLNTSPFLQGVWVRNNMDIGMECLGSSAVDMDPEMENAFKNNGWTEVDGDPLLDRIADVDEIWLYKNADVMIDEGNNDIYDDLGVDDHLMTRNDNLFQIDGTENYWKGALDDAFTPENPVLVTRADEGAGPYTTAGFDCDEEAYNLFIRALDNMKDEDFEDALDILCEIVTEFPDSRAAANTPMQILRCVRELDLDRERFRDFLLDIEVNNEILNSNRHLVANLFLLDLGEYEPAIENFTDVRDDAENQQDRIIAEMNLAYAEFIRSAREDHDGINSAGMSFDAKLKKLLNRLHSDSLSLVSSPLTFELCTVYPNPFNSTTTIRYKLTSAADISVNVFDMAGRQIAILHQGYIEAGEHTVSWIADDVPSGVYMVRLEAEGKVDVRKVVLMR